MSDRPPAAGGVGRAVDLERRRRSRPLRHGRHLAPSGRARVARSARTTRGILLWSLLAGLAVPTPSGAVLPGVRQILVADSEADPFTGGDRNGAIFILGYDSFLLRIATAGRGLVDPVAVATAPERQLYVVDSSADPLELGGSFGAIWLADPTANPVAPLRLAGASALFRAPADILVEEETGDLLVVDRESDPAGWGGRNGCVFRINPATNSISVLTSPSVFSDPVAITWDSDGSILVVDQTANPQGLPAPAGALFRLNPWTGSVTLERAFSRPQFVAPSAVAVIDHGPWEGQYLLADKDADPNERGTRPGAIFRLPRDGTEPVFYCDAQSFAEPVDVLMGVRDDVLVMDKLALTENTPLGIGAVFRFRLDDGALLQSPWGSNSFRSLSGFLQLAGAEVDSSEVVWNDENRGFIAPGDIFTVRAKLVNTGTADAEELVLSDTLQSPFQYVAGSDSFSAGDGGYNPARQEFIWRGSLARGDSATVRFRMRLADDAQNGWRYANRVTVRADQAPSSFLRVIIPHREFVPGVTAYADGGRIQGNDIGYLYVVGSDSLIATSLWQNQLLRRPGDLCFLEDGRLAILDPGCEAGDLGAILVYTTSSIDTVTVLRPLRRLDGLVSPHGLAIDRDGNLLLIDRNANPYNWPYVPNPLNGDIGPGALYRVNSRTGDLTLLAGLELWREPVDAVVDRKGLIVVLDYEGGTSRQGSIWELRPGSPGGRELPLEPTLFRDPVGIACDLANDLYICDPTFGGGSNPNGGAVLRMRRTNPVGYVVASAHPMLRQPVDCCLASNGNLFIADRDANPSNHPPGDHGAIFELITSSGRLEVAVASAVLKQPDGIASVVAADLNGSKLTMTSPAGGDPRPGDTLRVTAQLINRGLASAPQVLASLKLSPILRPVVEDPPPSGVSYDPANSQIAWTGRVAFGDTSDFTVRAVVLTGASYAEPAEIEMYLVGGRFPVRVRQSRPIRAPFTPNDILLTDETADPANIVDSLGAVFRIPETAGDRVRLVYSSLSLQRPSALEWSASGELILAATRGREPGQIYRFNTQSGGLVLLTPAADTTLKNPSDLLLANDGSLFVVDPDAPGPTPSSRGAVYRKGAGTGPVSLFAADSLFRELRQICYGPSGHLYLADSEADPGRLGGNTGAIFVLDEDTGQILDWVEEPTLMPEPVGVAPYDDSSVVVTDPYGSSRRGGLILYRPARHRVYPFVSLADFKSLWRTTRLSSGELLILDRGAVYPGKADTLPGLVFGFDPDSRRLRYHAWSDSFTKLSDITQKPGPVVRLSRYEAEDLNGPPLHPADKLRLRAMLRNVGPSVGLDVTYADSLPLGVSLIEGTAFADGGMLTASPHDIFWRGGIIPADSVSIVYDVQLNPALAEGRVLHFAAEVEAPSVGAFSRRLDVETHVPLEPGHLYLVDSDANPYQQPFHTGALFKVNLVTGAVVSMLVSDEFKKPSSIAFVGSQAAPKMLILDRQAPNQFQRLGTLFLFDPATRELRDLGGHATWMTPVRVLDWTQTEALVLDQSADPFDLKPGSSAGPGAVYRVNFETGDITPFFSDSTLVAPKGLAWLEPGRLAISDIEADPSGYGNKNGAVYTLDVESKELRFLASSPLWRTPLSIAARAGGGLLVADRDATPYDAGGGYGSVHAVNPDGQAVLLTVSKFFTQLNDIQSEPNGNPILTDGNSDPYLFGGLPGGVFRWRSSVNGRFVPLVSSRLFRNPEGFVSFGGVVPVAVTEAAIATTPEGILLTWRGSDDAPGARYVIYRREASGPDDPGDPDPSHSELLATGEEFLGAGPHQHLDAAVDAGVWYAYLVVGIDTDGSVAYSAPLVALAPDLVARLELARPAPHPFRPGRSLRYAVPAPGGRVELAIFDVAGRRVRQLVDGPVSPGRYTVTWDGRDTRGSRLPSGIYFARLSHRRDVRTARIVMLW